MMNFGTRQFVMLKGLNRRDLAIDTLQVNFLEEAEIDGKLVTNIHFGNGKWVTCGHPLREAYGLLLSTDESKSDSEKAEAEVKKQSELDRWKEMALARAKIQHEVNELVKEAGLGLKKKSYTKEVLPDGSGKLTIHFEPEEHSDPV